MSTGNPPRAGQAPLWAAVLRRATALAKPGEPVVAVFRLAADLAKGYAEHWEADAKKITGDESSAALMAHQWRIIEREFRGLTDEPTT
jgi:hypothetical protein